MNGTGNPKEHGGYFPGLLIKFPIIACGVQPPPPPVAVWAEMAVARRKPEYFLNIDLC